MVSSSSSNPNEIVAILIRGVLMHVFRPLGVSNTDVMTTPVLSPVPDQATPRTSILANSSSAKLRANIFLDSGNFISSDSNKVRNDVMLNTRATIVRKSVNIANKSGCTSRVHVSFRSINDVSPSTICVTWYSAWIPPFGNNLTLDKLKSFSVGMVCNSFSISLLVLGLFRVIRVRRSGFQYG